MKKTALPIIFIVAVAAALFYVSQEEHGTGTLALLSSVLLVGQVCATLPFILDAKKKRTGTATPDNAFLQKILANQQIIHEDLRSLGETLIRRLTALAERQAEIEKKVLPESAKPLPDMTAEFDDLFGKIRTELEERFENLNAETGNAELEKKLDSIDERLEELLFSVENLVPEEPDDCAEFKDANLSKNADFGNAEPEELPTAEVPEETVSAQSPEDESGDEEEAENPDEETPLEDFPESGEPDTPDATDEPPSSAARQGELELGNFSAARGATLVLDAMLGIENKPFLRGNGAELSEERGIPMEFVEIGKWSFDFAPLTEEITVRILKNDDENQPLGDPVTLAPGQNLELAYVPEKQ